MSQDGEYSPNPKRKREIDENNDIMNESSDDEEDTLDQPPRRLRRAETVLQNRTGRFVLILDNVKESFSQQAMIRTAESLGIQYIYSIHPVNKGSRRMCKSVMKGSKSWVTIRVFGTAEECLEHLAADGIELWSLVDSELGFERTDALLYEDDTDEADDKPIADDHQISPFIPHSIPLPLEPAIFASHKFWDSASAEIVETAKKNMLSLSEVYRQSVCTYHEAKSSSKLKNSCFESFSASESFANGNYSSCDEPSQSNWPLLTLDLPPKTSLFGFPPRIGIVIGNEHGQVNSKLTLSAHRYIYLPTYGFSREGFTPSVRLAVLLDRLFMLCPEARGDLTSQQRRLIRESWLNNLAKTPLQRERFSQWYLRWDEIKPLKELRIKEKVPMISRRLLKKLHILHNEATVPPTIKEECETSSQ